MPERQPGAAGWAGPAVEKGSRGIRAPGRSEAPAPAGRLPCRLLSRRRTRAPKELRAWAIVTGATLSHPTHGEWHRDWHRDQGRHCDYGPARRES